MTSRTWLAGLLLVAACGDNIEPTDDGIHGGSRLRAFFLAESEGARQFVTFHDRWLGIDCSFQGDPPRCLPQVAQFRDYLDADCTEPVFSRGVTDSCSPPPTHFGVAIDDACSSEPKGFQRIWKRGERAEPYILYSIGDEGCAARAWPRVDYEYYAAEFEIAVDAFATATREVSGEGRLLDVVFVGEDGSQQQIAFHDVELDADCWYDEQLELCVPELMPGTFSSDATCDEPLGAWSTSACGPPPSFIGGYAADGELEILERGYQVGSQQIYYRHENGVCYGQDPAAGMDYFRSGEDVADRLAPLEGTMHSSGRLRAYRHGGFLDRERGFDCDPVLTGPGVWHCVPELDATAVRLFADPLCEQGVDVFELEVPGKAVQGLIWRPSSENACENHARLYEVGSEIDSGNLYDRRLLGCQRLTWNPDEIVRYAVGRELGFDDYVRLTRATE
jgi:hypothetical protein